MQVNLYNSDGSIIGKTDVPEAMFGRRWNPDLVHQVIRAIESNARRPLAHTKGRGEVSGGGRKPWRQKGTGRARHGSIRSPLWRGGGVTHGPTNERDVKKKANKKMRRLALFTALSRKVQQDELRVVRSLSLPEPKTKYAVRLLTAILGAGRVSALIVPAAESEGKLRRASHNVDTLRSVAPENLNARDVLRFKYVVIEEPAIAMMEKTFVK